MNEEDIKNQRLAFKGGGDQLYDTDLALFYQFKKDKDTPPQYWGRKLTCTKNRQDDILFDLDSILVMGDIILTSPIKNNIREVSYKNKDNRYTAKPTVTTYKEESNFGDIQTY